MMVVKSYKELGFDPRPGDKVKIKDYPTGVWFSDEMKKYLSRVMTVRKFIKYGDIHGGCCYMLEDWYDFDKNGEPGWIWEMCDIEGLVIEEQEDIIEDPSVWVSEEMLDVLLT